MEIDESFLWCSGLILVGVFALHLQLLSFAEIQIEFGLV